MENTTLQSFQLPKPLPVTNVVAEVQTYRRQGTFSYLDLGESIGPETVVLHRDGFVPRAHLTMSRDTSVRKGGGCWGDQYWHLVGRGQMLLNIRQAPKRKLSGPNVTSATLRSPESTEGSSERLVPSPPAPPLHCFGDVEEVIPNLQMPGAFLEVECINDRLSRVPTMGGIQEM